MKMKDQGDTTRLHSRRASGPNVTRRQFLMAGFALALVGCAPSPPAPAAPPPGSGAPATGVAPATTGAAPAGGAPAPAKPTAGPRRGGILRMPIFTEALPINALINVQLSSLLVRRAIFSYLTRVDPETMQPVPDLATKWEVSPDGLTWTFTLRNDVKWHDGKPFSAEDVKFTFDTIADPKQSSVERTNYQDVDRVEVVNPTTVRFRLKNALMSLPVITGATVDILPKHILEGQDLRKATEFNNVRPIGTGPFKVKTIVAGSHVEVVANDEFYRGRPNLDGIVFKLIPDINVRVAQLKSGELDFATIEPANLAAVQGDPSLEILEYPAPETQYFGINQGNPLFGDKRVRQALVLGLDRKAILDTAVLGRGNLMTATIPIALKEWYNADLKPYPFDPAKALALLAEAGWKAGPDGVLAKDGQRFAFKVQTEDTSAVRIQMAVLAQQYWKKLGMDPVINQVDRQVSADNHNNHRFDTSVLNTPSSYDPDSQRRYYLCGAPSNFGQYCNPEVDRLLKTGVQETDPTKRKAIYNRYQELVYDEVHVIPVYYPSEIRVTTRRLKGLNKLPIRNLYQYLDSWYFSE